MDLGQNIGKFKNSHKCTIFHPYGLIFLWSKAMGTLYTWTQCALWIWYISLKFSVGKDCRRSPCYSSQALMRLAARVLNDMHLFCRKPAIFKTETNSASQTPDQSDLASLTKDNTIILEFSIKREEGIYKKSRKLIKRGNQLLKLFWCIDCIFGSITISCSGKQPLFLPQSDGRVVTRLDLNPPDR